MCSRKCALANALQDVWRGEELVCKECGAHLGHVFKGEGYATPTNERHCVNGLTLYYEARVREFEKPASVPATVPPTRIKPLPHSAKAASSSPQAISPRPYTWPLSARKGVFKPDRPPAQHSTIVSPHPRECFSSTC